MQSQVILDKIVRRRNTIPVLRIQITQLSLRPASSFFPSVPIQLSRPCRHPFIRTLCERYSPGARWVFSFSRCCYLIIDLSPHFCGSWAPGLSRSHLDSAAVEFSVRIKTL